LLRTALGAILEGGASSERLEGVTSAIKGLMGTVVTVAGAVGDMVDEWQDEVLGVLEQAPMVGVAFTLIKKLVGRGKMATVRFSSECESYVMLFCDHPHPLLHLSFAY
jgi:hypothetical protein